MREEPRLIDGLDGVEGLVIAPLGQKTLNRIDSPVNIVLVNRLVVKVQKVEFTHPLTNGKVVEDVLAEPLGPVRLARVVIAVLRSFDGVHIEQNLEAVLLGGIQSPLDFILGAVHATHIGAVGLESPVTDGEADNFDLTISHLLEVLLSDPRLPMLTNDCVTLFSTERLAEAILVHADAFGMSLAEEAVEERRGDPGLDHHPAT